MNLISFSLYGENPKYHVGAIENAQVIRSLLPNWKARFYCDYSISKDVLQQLQEANAEIVLRRSSWHSNGMFWRYLPIGEPGVNRILFRDADSRIGERDFESIDKWLASGFFAHIIRDHPFHQTPILGGLWGMKNFEFDTSHFWDLASNYSNEFGEDQRFLSAHVYPMVRRNALIHDPFFAFEPQKIHESLTHKGLNYMGESFSAHNEVDEDLRIINIKYQNSRRLKLILRIKSKLQSKFISCKAYFVPKGAISIPKR
jgi:hypothetical protein